ncbi:MAG: hypothetical protein ACJAVN_002160 [Roseivirga sp.]
MKPSFESGATRKLKISPKGKNCLAESKSILI